MDIPLSTHFQTPDDEEDQFHSAVQEPFYYSTYCQDGKSGDVHQEKWQELVVSADAITQEGFSLSSSPNLTKAKRRKSPEKVEAHGGRIIRSGGGKRDRHSKVCTARGPRDRRVRLSPKTAIQFYDVQDRLGYDRPSKAIDWLMKEAKAAIDALDEPPSQAAIAAGNHSSPNGGIIPSECGIMERFKHMNNDIPDSSFGFFTNGGAAPLSSNEECPDGFLSSISTSDLFDPYSEMIRLQRIFHFPGSQMFCEREPLQSIITNNSPISPQFPGFRLPSEEIPNLAAATWAQDGMDKIFPASSKPPSASSFLHY